MIIVDDLIARWLVAVLPLLSMRVPFGWKSARH